MQAFAVLLMRDDSTRFGFRRAPSGIGNRSYAGASQEALSDEFSALPRHPLEACHNLTSKMPKWVPISACPTNRRPTGSWYDPPPAGGMPAT